jgi:hypothetical protein
MRTRTETNTSGIIHEKEICYLHWVYPGEYIANKRKGANCSRHNRAENAKRLLCDFWQCSKCQAERKNPMRDKGQDRLNTVVVVNGLDVSMRPRSFRFVIKYDLDGKITKPGLPQLPSTYLQPASNATIVLRAPINQN